MKELKVKIGELNVKIFVADLRLKFRQWLCEANIRRLMSGNDESIICDFLASSNIKMSDTDRGNFTFFVESDIDKRISGAKKLSGFHSLNNQP